jgi:ubiquinone/menaquinone biosynthesis C-methylase UbiE
MRINNLWNPFGKEYAWSPRWGSLERCYIRAFGLVDLPSRLRARLVIRTVRKFQSKTLLDFGCGAGTYSFYFSRLPTVQVTGMDFNESRIADCRFIAEKIGRNNATFYSDAGHTGLRRFDNESFDSVLAIEVFQYLPDLELTMLEIHRVLKSGGYLFGHIPALGYLRETEHNIFDDKGIQNLLIETGFEIVVLTSTFGGPIQELCKLFNRIMNLKLMAAIFYPLLLILSSPFRVESDEGAYRFFVARKPAKINEREACSLGGRGAQTTSV